MTTTLSNYVMNLYENEYSADDTESSSIRHDFFDFNPTFHSSVTLRAFTTGSEETLPGRSSSSEDESESANILMALLALVPIAFSLETTLDVLFLALFEGVVNETDFFEFLDDIHLPLEVDGAGGCGTVFSDAFAFEAFAG